MSIKSGNQPQQQLPNKYKDIKGYLNSNNHIPMRALLKETSELLELPPNAVLLNPVKINAAELLTKAVKFYNEGQTFNVTAKDIKDCFNVLLLNEDDSKLIIGAVTFAPFIVENDELVVYILLLKVKKNEQRKGSGAALFDIMKKFTSKCQLFAEYSKVQLLLSASTALKPHGFFLKQGCEFVVDIDLLELTQKDSTLMRLKLVDKKCGDLFINERANNLQMNNQNITGTAILENMEHHDNVLNINIDHNQDGGRTPRDEETKQAFNGQNGHQPDHLFDNIQNITPNDSNCNRNEVQEFKLPLNMRNLKVLDKQQDATSDIGSKVSMVSNKTKSGAIKRHCEPCGFKHISDWVKHKKIVHGGVEAPSVKCLPLCPYCTGKFRLFKCSSRSWRQISELVSNLGVSNLGVSNLGVSNLGVGVKSRSVKYRSWCQISELVSNLGVSNLRVGVKSRSWCQISELVSNLGVSNLGVGVKSRSVKSRSVKSRSVKSRSVKSRSVSLLQQQNQQPVAISRHEKHKEYECQVCKKVKQSRLFPKNSKVCAVCEKKLKGTKSAINAPLNNDQMMIDFDNDAVDHQIDPDDSISMVGTKRLAKKPLDFIEVLYETTNDEIQGEPLSSAVMPRQVQDTQTQSSQRHNGEMIVTSVNPQPAAVVYVSYTDSSLLQLLKDIEISSQTFVELSLKLQKICKMLTQDIAIEYLNSGQPTKLLNLISELLLGASQLSLEDRTGLLVASFVLGGACWNSSVKMLSVLTSTQRIELFDTFTLYIRKFYSTEVAEWVINNWKVVEDQHLQLIKHLKLSKLPQPQLILNLALGVTFNDIPRFVQTAEIFVTYPIVELVLECLATRPKQQKISFDTLLNLISCVRADANQLIITTYRQQLVDAPLAGWIEIIEEKKAHLHVLDADSIQLFLDQLIAKYGESDPKLSEDLTKSSDARFGLLVHLVKQFRPNSRQFALAQYCVGRMSKKQRQLWCVLWGQGKSRISATVAAIAVMIQIVGKVYIIHESKHSMGRDQKDFQAYWTLLGIDGSTVEYRVGINFVPEPNCLIIFDEADLFMFKHPLEFAQIINGCFCICFTATPDNKDPEGAQSKAVNILQFSRYDYLLDAQADEPPHLEMDAIIDASSVELKAGYIMQQLASGPMLIFCDKLLAEQLKVKAGDVMVNVTEDTDYNVLRSLDQQPFKIVVAQDEFAMRAFDYRCEKATMTEVIDKSFSTTIEALQGFHRVGRFGDQCRRVRFQDVQVVDHQQELQQTANLFKYISGLQKTQIHVKKATAKATLQQRNTGASNLAKKQVQTAQQIIELQKKQQQQQTIKDFITTNKNK